MSFIAVVEQDLDAAGQAALAAAKTTVNYIDNVITQDIAPELLTALLSALEKWGEAEVTALLGNGPSTSSAAPPTTSGS